MQQNPVNAFWVTYLKCQSLDYVSRYSFLHKGHAKKKLCLVHTVHDNPMLCFLHGWTLLLF